MLYQKRQEDLQMSPEPKVQHQIKSQLRFK